MSLEPVERRRDGGQLKQVRWTPDLEALGLTRQSGQKLRNLTGEDDTQSGRRQHDAESRRRRQQTRGKARSIPQTALQPHVEGVQQEGEQRRPDDGGQKRLEDLEEQPAEQHESRDAENARVKTGV